jgi:prepilin signal peptidase PulO-like enzyme (type II secretory pathway)
VVGALLGWRALPAVVFSASFVGVIVSIPALLLQQRHRSAAPDPASPRPGEAVGEVEAAAAAEADAVRVPLRRSEVPFGPFLSLSAFVYLLAGPQIQAHLLAWLVGGDIPLD